MRILHLATIFSLALASSACSGLGVLNDEDDTIDSTAFEAGFLLLLSDPANVCAATANLGAQGANIGTPYSPYCLRRWPGAVVPYVIEPEVGGTGRITTAIADWEAKTVVRFIAHTTETDYVVFRRGDFCLAGLGITGSGPQIVTLSDLCSAGTVAHELGHVIGLAHEHARPDRDQYVTINWGNIWPADQPNFFIETGRNRIWSSAYDFDSIMHYRSGDFFNGSGPTIVKKDGSNLSSPVVVSAGDAAAVNAMYSQ